MTHPPHYTQKYRIKGNRLYETVAGKNGSFERLLCNFVSWITAEITLNDGAETTKSLLKAMAEEGLIQPGATQNTRPLRIGDKQKRVVYLYREKAERIRDAGS